MKKTVTLVAMICVGIIAYACNNVNKDKSDESATQEVKNTEVQTDAEAQKDGEKQAKGEVIVMNKAMFLKEVFDYENSKELKYKGSKPAIIDFYADWCGPCRMTAPIMKELAKEYADQIVIYKVNVDKERELAAQFRVSSIPLFIFIPMNGKMEHYNGAADKETYKNIIEDFLLKKE